MPDGTRTLGERVIAEAAEELARETSFVALDFETATADRSSACALGVARVEYGEVVAEAYWLLRPPGNRYDSRNIEVHGIRPADTAEAPSLADVWDDEVAPWLVPSPLLLAHNAAFDLYVLRDSLAAGGLTLPETAYGCTLSLARKALPSLPNHRLDTLSRRFGIELRHHDAASDARACALVGLAVAREIGFPADVRAAFAARRVRLRTMEG